jgi:hypothetical protein
MTDKNFPDDFERSAEEGPESALERKLIREFLREKGYSMQDLRKLPREEAKRLMREACQYAALKLAEVESKARFRREIRTPSS